MQSPHSSLLRRVADYPSVALVLQGGGALGAYQCGVYDGLHEAGIHPNWIAGISIGAINAALIAGNAVDDRVPALRTFWERVSEPAGILAWPALAIRSAYAAMPDGWLDQGPATAMSALAAMWQGQRGFYVPRAVSPFLLSGGSAEATSLYDTAPLLDTLNELVDFERIRRDGSVRLTVGATDVVNGNFRYFDSRHMRLDARHIMASAALPPSFAPVEVDGRHYWDGGLVSNTPLEHILNEWPREDTLAFQVDLWSARGEHPQTMLDVLERIKDIQYSSRTRHGTDTVARMQQLRTALAELVTHLPQGEVPDHLQDALARWMDDRVVNIIHLIYQAKPHETAFKGFAFGRMGMQAHWQAGRHDTAMTLEHPDYFILPDRDRGYAVHDVHRKAAGHPTAG